MDAVPRLTARGMLCGLSSLHGAMELGSMFSCRRSLRCYSALPCTVSGSRSSVSRRFHVLSLPHLLHYRSSLPTALVFLPPPGRVSTSQSSALAMRVPCLWKVPSFMGIRRWGCRRPCSLSSDVSGMAPSSSCNAFPPPQPPLRLLIGKQNELVTVSIFLRGLVQVFSSFLASIFGSFSLSTHRF